MAIGYCKSTQHGCIIPGCQCYHGTRLVPINNRCFPGLAINTSALASVIDSLRSGASGEPPPFDHGDEARHPYAGEVEFYRDMSRRLRMWHWLCGIDPPGDPARGAKLFVAASPLRDVVAAATGPDPAGGDR